MGRRGTGSIGIKNAIFHFRWQVVALPQPVSVAEMYLAASCHEWALLVFAPDIDTNWTFDGRMGFALISLIYKLLALLMRWTLLCWQWGM